jgi:hypothetical protein
MNKVLKWILYILLGLVVLAVIAGIVFAVFGAFRTGMMRPGFRGMQPGFRIIQHMPYNFSPFRLLFGGLFGLGVFVLVIVGIVALVNALVRSNRPAQMTPTAQIAPPVQMTAPSRTCSNCGKPSQDDWKICPYCGNPLT